MRTLVTLALLASAQGLSLKPQIENAQEGDAILPQAKVVNSFNCKVDEVSVVLDQKPEKVADAIDISTVRSHFGDPKTLEWAHIGQQFFSDIDGRSEEKILGTPGGDIAEFILALSSYEEETKGSIDQATATGLLMEYLKTMSRTKFYMSTSEHAHDNLTSASGCKNVEISDPPEGIKAMLLEAVTQPDNVGCKHLKMMLSSPAEYQTRKEIVEIGIRSYYQVMWNKTFTGHTKLCFIMLKGPHKEKAFVNVQAAQHCQDQGLAPLISPQACYGDMYINHPEAVIKFRAELANFLAQSNKPLAQSIITRMNDKGTTQLAKTASKLLKGYPVYTVSFGLAKK